MKTKFTPLFAAAVLALAPAFAAAQTTPAPTTPMTAPTPPPTTSMPSTPAPVSEPTAAPSTAPSSSGSSGAAATPAPKATMSTNPNAKKLANIKKIPNGSLSTTDLRYGLTHPLQEANKVRQLKSISFDKLRVYRLSSGLKSMLKIGDANADIPALAVLGPGTLIAQTSGLPGTNGSNSPIAYLQYVLANINVSNALNNVNVLNNSTVNVGVTLQDVLNGNKISIGSVAGIFVNSLGIITTITK